MKARVFFLSLIIIFTFKVLQAQEDSLLTKKTDSLIVNVTDTVSITSEKPHSPRKAALFSALVPGLGQIYNKKYWKLPIFYVPMGLLIYFATEEHQQYLKFRQSVNAKIAIANNPDLIVGDPFGTLSLEVARANRNVSRRNREYLTILTILVYALNIVDAAVDAHLKDFDLSDDLSLNLEPAMFNFQAQQAIGVTLTLSFK